MEPTTEAPEPRGYVDGGLHWADYVIFSLFLCISLGIGFFYACTGGRQRTTKEFIMADRKLNIVPTMLSLLVSHQSAIMILGNAAEMYTRGSLAWLWMSISFLFSVFICERIVIPWLYPLGLTSIYEYFELRYQSKILRAIGSFLGTLALVLYMGTALYAPSVALEAATDFPMEVSMPLMAVVCTAYTALGGMKAVIWTDVFQFVIMIAGMLAVLIKGTVDMGGFTKVLDIADDNDRIQLTEWSSDPTIRHTIWGFIFGYTMNWIYLFGFNQASFQRYCATPALRDARMVMLLNIPAVIFMVAIACMTGLTVLAYYASIQCDPLESGMVDSPNQILATFVKYKFRNATGFSGLFLSTLYGGALSSVSSGLSACAANTWEDILKQIPKLRHLSDFKATIINKVLVVFYGGMTILIAFLASEMPGPVTQVSQALVGSVSGPLLGLFIIGGISRFTDMKGAICGVAAGLAINLWIQGGKYQLDGLHPRLPPVSTEGCDFPFNASAKTVYPPFEGLDQFYSLSYLWYVPIGCLTCMLVSTIVSLIPPQPPQQLATKLLISCETCCTWSTLPDQDEDYHNKTDDDNYIVTKDLKKKEGIDNMGADIGTYDTHSTRF